MDRRRCDDEGNTWIDDLTENLAGGVLNSQSSLTILGSPSNLLLAWDLGESDEVTLLSSAPATISALALSQHEAYRNSSLGGCLAVADARRMIGVGILGPLASRPFTEPFVFHVQLAEAARTLRFSPDARIIAAGVGRTILLIDLQTTPERWAFPHLRELDQEERANFLWRLETLLRSERAPLQPDAPFAQCPATVRSVEFSLCGRFLATGGDDRVVRVFELSSGREVSCFNWEIGRIRCVRFAPDGMTAAACGRRDILIWDLEL